MPMEDHKSGDSDESDGHPHWLPSPAKRRNIGVPPGSGTVSSAAVYQTKFQKGWQQTWPSIAPVKDNPHSFHCTLCMKTVSCGHQGNETLRVMLILLSTRKVLRPWRIPGRWVSHLPVPWIHWKTRYLNTVAVSSIPQAVLTICGELNTNFFSRLQELKLKLLTC